MVRVLGQSVDSILPSDSCQNGALAVFSLRHVISFLAGRHEDDVVTEFPQTRDSLLVRVRSPGDREAWDQFASLYRPVIYRVARCRGLQDADAQDLAQQILIAVAAAIGHYEKSPEIPFRHWLRRVIRNAIASSLARRPHDRAAGGTTIQTLLAEQPGLDQASDGLVELEYRRELFLQAARFVRADVAEETWQAFELTVVDGCSIERAAAELGKSVGTIYAARSRVMRRLREAVRELEHSEP